MESSYLALLERLKVNGKKIVIPFDECEVKENNYSSDTREAHITPYGFYSTGKEYQPFKQSVVIFFKDYGRNTQRFVSPIFPMDKITLSSKIIIGKLILYVNSLNTNEYSFELLE
jgi:hypothetical protein